jgi:hypothetical protein
MTTSFKIVNGDLSIGNSRSFETVSGQDKLLQDLKLWVLERMGTDPLTPGYGSRLDGGVENGRLLPSYIGRIMSERTIAEIKAEVTDLLTRYQTDQYNKLRTENLRYGGNNTFDAGEIIATVNSIKVVIPTPDLIAVQVSLTTMAQTNINLTIPLSQQGIR